MFNKSIVLAFSLAAAFGFTQSTTAAEDTAAPATVIVYRADESVKTKRINLGVIAEDSNAGRLSVNKLVIAQHPAGAFTLGTTIAGTEPLTLDLKPGATYYVHAQVGLRSNRITVDLQEVPEQVARVQNPALEAAI